MQDGPAGPAVIDCHFHVWNEPFPGRPFPWTPDPFPAAEMLRLMDANGVARGVQITPIMLGWNNAYGIETAAATGQRISVFGRFDPFAPEAETRLQQWMATAGAAGVRLTFYGDDLKRLDKPEQLDPFWGAAAKLGVPVAVFAPDALWKIVAAVERHPDLRLIVDHVGLGVYPGCEDPFKGYPALQELAPFKQVLVKISGAIEISKEKFPFADMHETIAETCERFGPARLMWGSNFPVAGNIATYEEALGFVEALDFLSAADRAEILGGTCARLLADDAAGK